MVHFHRATDSQTSLKLATCTLELLDRLTSSRILRCEPHRHEHITLENRRPKVHSNVGRKGNQTTPHLFSAAQSITHLSILVE